MSEDKATKPKFLTPMKIEPEEITRPEATGVPTIVIEISAIIQTGGSTKVPIYYELSHPNGKSEPLRTDSVGNTGTENEGKSLLKYDISHEHPVGEYKLTAKIVNCNEDCERTGSFTVKKNPLESEH